MDLRAEEHRIWLDMIEEKEGLTNNKERQASFQLAAARGRMGFERRDAMQRTQALMREKDELKQWANNYGVAVCQARFGGSEKKREDGAAKERSAMLRKPWDVYVRSNILSSDEMLKARQSGGMPAFLGTCLPPFVSPLLSFACWSLLFIHVLL